MLPLRIHKDRLSHLLHLATPRTKTKGMHFLAKFAPNSAECGVWSDGAALTAIEAYPSACKQSSLFEELLERYVSAEQVDPPAKEWIAELDHQDKLDALTCALISWVFTHSPEDLVRPDLNVPTSEGWIWVPEDGLPTAHQQIIRVEP